MHTRRFQCTDPACNVIPDFTSKRALTTHEQEVHRKHGGPYSTLHYCPGKTCKRRQGEAFPARSNMRWRLYNVHNIVAADAYDETLDSVLDGDHFHEDVRHSKASASRTTMLPPLYSPLRDKCSFPTDRGSYREAPSPSVSSAFSARSERERDSDYHENERLRQTVDEKNSEVAWLQGRVGATKEEEDREIARLQERVARLEGVVQAWAKPSDRP